MVPPWLGLEPGRKVTLPPGLNFVYTGNMKKAISVHKKSRGRPATGQDPLISARVPTATVAAIETWAVKNGATRSGAIRRLIELGLSIKGSAKQSVGSAHRAKELATNAIDKMINRSAPPEERAQRRRRRRLTKGPIEFREDRVDLPKDKEK